MQATCPYHRGTDTAPKCRRTMAIPTKDGLVATRKALKVWCIMGNDYDRKYVHLQCDLTAGVDALSAFTVERLA